MELIAESDDMRLLFYRDTWDEDCNFEVHLDGKVIRSGKGERFAARMDVMYGVHPVPDKLPKPKKEW